MELSFSTISCINKKSITELKKHLRENGYHIYEIDGTEIINAKTFFAEIVKVLPQNPPLSGRENYDAFTDSVWEGIVDLELDKVAILWTDVNNILNGGLEDLLKIVRSLFDLEDDLLDIKNGQRFLLL